MALDTYAQSLADRIEREYDARRDSIGWRFLYSPASVLNGARVAFIGLNPGGSNRPADHAEFAMETGSAYAMEPWGNSSPGESPLQRQVLALFDRLGEEPADVLAGNLVPFRSPSWDTLDNSKQALVFGKDLWTDVLTRAKPQIVVSMGSDATKSLADILRVQEMEHIPVNWGKVSAARGGFSGGVLIGIPHLSRFQIMTRPESEPALEKLFET